MRYDIPQEVKAVISRLEQEGHQAYVVGGCVRDILLGKKPKDWDVATSAKPEEIQKAFPKSFYENQFFTVTVLTENEDPSLKEVEITTFRADIRYGDRRHPEEIAYASTIEEDLARRDFTVNALALKLLDGEVELCDPFHGQEDLKNKLIRAVGDPNKRFQEDALRMMRAVRFFATLGFALEPATREAIRQSSRLISEISAERIRDEFVRIIMSDLPAEGIEELRELGLLSHFLPELEEGYGVGQNKHHIYTVWEHNVRSLKHAAEQNWSFPVRLASLLHDVAKPRVKQGEGPESTFYGHQVVGAKMTRKALERLRFPRETVELISLLVREHMFVYDPDTVTLRGVRRLLARVSKEHIDELFQLREADRIGSGVPKAQPYRLRHLKAMVDKVKQDPIGPKMLKINGDEIMEMLKMGPGRKIGAILAVLLEEVLDDPERNTKEYLHKRVKELGKLSEQELHKMGEEARRTAIHAQERVDEEIKKKHFVK